MKGKYIPFSDDYGIVGYHFICPQCKYENQFSTNECCEKCDFEQDYVDPDDYFSNSKVKQTGKTKLNMENKYKIRNSKKIKIERVGVILTEKEVIDEFGLPVDTLIDSKIVEEVGKEILSEVKYAILTPYGTKLIGKRGDYTEKEVLDLFSNEAIIYTDIYVLTFCNMVEAYQDVTQVELKQDNDAEV